MLNVLTGVSQCVARIVIFALPSHVRNILHWMARAPMLVTKVPMQPCTSRRIVVLCTVVALRKRARGMCVGKGLSNSRDQGKYDLTANLPVILLTFIECAN